MRIKKVGFYTAVALVISGQIGSGVFVSPSVMAPYGVLVFVGWTLAGLCAISLALVFAKLCSLFPKTGGPHVYAKAAFGNDVSFFVGWTYWVISWISSIALIKTGIGYFMEVVEHHSELTDLYFEIAFLSIMSLLNLRGIKFISVTEIIMTIVKLILLIIFPLASFHIFNVNNFLKDSSFVFNTHLLGDLGKVLILAIWGFIGVEVATTSAESVNNPKKTVPRALIIGTIIVALIYIANSLAIFGGVPNNQLINSSAPYVDFIHINFRADWKIPISLMIFFICMNSLYTWILSAGQVGLGIANDRLFPKIFSNKNKFGAPYFSIIISAVCSIPILILTHNRGLLAQVTFIIDLSVIAFVFVYLVCTVGLVKILVETRKLSVKNIIYSSIALCFCVYVLASSSFSDLLFALAFTTSGIPVYIWQKYYSKNSAWCNNVEVSKNKQIR